ncbi:unnamed protein product [Rhodiola kirilowii]
MALMSLRDEFIASRIPSDESSLNSWNSSLHFCQWQGVTCGKRHKRVTAIDLTEQKLNGAFSASIGNLTFLRELYLTNNSLHGEIPKEIGQLRRLQYLLLDGNSFEGRIPIELSNCSNLLKLDLSRNKITGRISLQLGSLSKLTWFRITRNNIIGEMPCFFRNMSLLTSLRLAENLFRGEINQDCLQGLSKLTNLALSYNYFSGTISALYNVSSSLDILDISNNNFTGTLGRDMYIAFPKLTFLSLSRNMFTGTIPSSLANISGLTVIQIARNNLSGRVPGTLGRLENLRRLNLVRNNLGGERSGDLNFIDSLTNCTKLEKLFLSLNMFSSSLPNSVSNFTSKLNWFTISKNFVTGSIPERIGELSGLTVVDFNGNLLTGTIPKSIGKLTNVSILYLDQNKLHGGIPSSIGNLTRLYNLDLSLNSFDGVIPTTLGNCKRMQKLDVSRNQLSGNLPDNEFTQFQDLLLCNLSHNSFSGIFPSVGKLIHLTILDASGNKFSGEIPAQIGDLSSLETLSMARNFFKGSIPVALGRLTELKWLDLSNNNLSGVIPKNLVEIRGLKYLNVSYNHLQGEVPLFQNISEFSVVGNHGLCGGLPQAHLQQCLRPRKRKTISRAVVIGIIISVITSFSLFVLIFIFFWCRIKDKENDTNELTEGYQRVTYAELLKATRGFAESNLIGSGGFGDVYRGILDGNERKPIAVKVLNLSKHGATKSFETECKVLRRIRHRNLLRIITSCSSLDHKGNDFKALVFDFMPNGSLDSWLYFNDREQREPRRVLTLAKRLEIAIDVGCALDYLYNCCETPIVHCDLKPSNILLDEDLVARVGDFGLAKMFQLNTENLSGGESLSTAIKGSIGYIAPEYGMGAAISPQGDIYSYGILLLELIIGKRPTGDMFNNEMSLRNLCERALQVHVHEIVDECLVNQLREATATQKNPEEFKNQWHTFLTSFVEVGLSCSMDFARDRMDIQSAIKCLKGIKEKYDMVC